MPKLDRIDAPALWQQVTATAKDWDAAGEATLLKIAQSYAHHSCVRGRAA